MDHNEVWQAKFSAINELNRMVASLADKADGFTAHYITIFATILASYFTILKLSDYPYLAVFLIVALWFIQQAFHWVFRRYGNTIRLSIDKIILVREEISALGSSNEVYEKYVGFVGSYRHPFLNMPKKLKDVVFSGKFKV